MVTVREPGILTNLVGTLLALGVCWPEFQTVQRQTVEINKWKNMEREL